MHKRLLVLSPVLFALFAVPSSALALTADVAITATWPTELPTKAGEIVTFTATLTAQGNSPSSGTLALNGSLSDAYGDRLFSFPPELNPGCRRGSGAYVLCDFGPIMPGAFKTVPIKLKRTTWCDAREMDFDFYFFSLSGLTKGSSDVGHTLSLDCPVADLEVTAVPVEKNFIPGDPVTVRATVKNNGPADAALVDVIFHLPRAGTFMTDGSSKDISCAPYAPNEEKDLYVCRLPAISSGKEKVVDARFALTSFDIANCKATTGITIGTEVFVRSAEDIHRSTPDKGGLFYAVCPKGTTTKGFTASSREVAKPAGKPTVKIDGKVVIKPSVDTQFIFNVTNTGKKSAPDVRLNFILPEAYKSQQIPDSCKKETMGYSCSLGELKAGKKGKVQVRFAVSPSRCDGREHTIEASTTGIEGATTSTKLVYRCVK